MRPGVVRFMTLLRKQKYFLKCVAAVLIFFHLASLTAFAQTAGSAGTAPDGMAALIDLLQKKKVISPDEAAGLTKQAAGGTVSNKGLAALVDLLKKKNVISAEEATALVGQNAAGKNVAGTAAEEGAIAASQRSEKEQIRQLNEQVSDVTQQVAELYSGKAAQLAASAPEWTKRVRFGGDMRLRYENDRFSDGNALLAQPANPSQLMNTQTDSNRFKYRVRVGAEADVGENMTGTAKLQAAARLSTGNSSTPVSTNSLMGDYMNKDNVLFDQAYLKFTWKTLDNIPTVVTGYAGRMPNPWFSSDLLWAADLNFEGFALDVKKPLTESLTSFMTLGGFPLQENDFTEHDKWLFAGQLGLQKDDRMGIGYEIGAAYYYYLNTVGIKNSPLDPGATDWTAPLYQQKGNTLFNISTDPNVVKTALASEFKEVDLMGALDIGYWDPYHIVLFGDFVKNRGFNQADVNARAGYFDKYGVFHAPPDETIGYQIGLSVGRPALETDYEWTPNWKAFINYKYVGADAVVDAFTDADFHLGGTNAKGWVLGGEYGLMKNTWLSVKWLTADQISGLPLRIDVLQVDLNAKF